MGVKVDVLVGDFDSLGSIPSDVDEIVRVPAKKDQTDVQLAVNIAIERGADDIIIVGSTDGRLDHTLSLLAMLEELWDKKIPAHVVNGRNRVRYLRDSGVIIMRSAYRYFSVIALDKKVKGVTIDGGEYPLVKKEIARGRKKSLAELCEKLKKTIVAPEEQTIFISHGDCLADAEYLADLIRRDVPVKEIVIDYIGSVIGTHSGQGTMALFNKGDKR
jgi:thiamine pyrophosphokinase